FRTDQTRYHLTSLCGGRSDLQSRVSCLADSLPTRSGANDKNEHPRCDQDAGTCETRAGTNSSGSHVGRLWAIQAFTHKPKIVGATSARSVHAPVMTRVSAARKLWAELAFEPNVQSPAG